MAILQSCCCWRSLRKGAYASAIYTMVLGGSWRKMAILQSCCCWRSLRKGAYASAIYTMVYFTITVLIMMLFVKDEWAIVIGESNEPSSNSFLEREMVSVVTVYFNLVLLVWACLGWLSCLVLMIGIYTDTKYLLVPWVFIVVGMMMLDLSHTAYLLASGSTEFEPLTAVLFTLDFFNSSLQTYSVLCVVSLYQEYKAGRGTADFEYINRRVPGVRYAPQPTGTSFLSTRRAVTYHETRASPTGSPPQDRTSSRKHVQFGDDRTWLAPPPSVIHIESPKATKLRPYRTYSNSTRYSNVSFDSGTSSDTYCPPSVGQNGPPPTSPISLESTIQEGQSDWTSASNVNHPLRNFTYQMDTDLTHGNRKTSINSGDSVSSDLNGRSGASPSEEGNSSGEWPGVKQIVDTEPLITRVKAASQVSM